MSLEDKSPEGLIPAGDISAAKQLAPIAPGKHPNSQKNLKAPWVKGQAPPPGAGRPLGARQKIGNAFIEAMHKDFMEHGKDVIRMARIEDPVAYLKIVAGLLPKDFELKPSDDLKDLFDLVARGGVKLIEENGQKFIEAEMKDITPTPTAGSEGST